MEPWPKDAAVYQTHPDQQMILPDRANVLAVKTFLKMCGLNYLVESRVNAAEMSPSGRVPFIKVGSFVVSEFDAILSFIKKKGFCLHEELSDSDRGEMSAYMDSVHKYLVNAQLYLSWCDQQIYDSVTRERYGCMYPWFLNIALPYFMRRDVKKTLAAIGWSKKTITEVYTDVNNCCEALSERLGEQTYFFGEHPTELDALVFGHIYTMLERSPTGCDLPHIIKPYSNLILFCQRIISTYRLEHVV